MKAGEQDIDDAVQTMADAGVRDLDRYRLQLQYWARYWPASYLEPIARSLVPVARKWEGP